MLGLSKSEYETLLGFYEINQAVSKRELLEILPELNPNTIASVLKKLLEQGYLEVAEIKYSNTVLERAYQPCVPFSAFMKKQYGDIAIEQLVKRTISSLVDLKLLDQFLIQVAEKKYLIQK